MTANRPPVSVILPTLEWGPACDQVADQLRPGDELLVVCDTAADPVAGHEPPDGVEILVAGEPEGCAAKANAVAHGMERATNDRFVWSDDDYEHGDDWLDRLVEAGQDHGAAALEPLFVSEGRCGRLLEPAGAVGLAVAGLVRDEGYPWGGGVTFGRDELDGSVADLCDELRSCVSDDNALRNHLGDVRTLPAPRPRVRFDGRLADTANRLVRWCRADHVRHDRSGPLAWSLLLAGLAAAFPLLVAPLVTVVAWRSYARLGYDRNTFLLAYPALFVVPVALAAGILVDEFACGRRRYRVDGLYDVTVVRRARARRSGRPDRRPRG